MKSFVRNTSVSVVISLLAITSAIILVAEAPVPARECVLHDDGNGLPVVEVTLHSNTAPNTAKKFRFILDTGAGKTVLDASIPSDFFWDDSKMATGRVLDYTGQAGRALQVLVKRMEVGGIMRDGVSAIVMDLKGSVIGKIQDEPVDGIVGMSFLRGIRFQLKPKEDRIEWWGLPFPRAAILPLTYKNDLPFVSVKLDGIEVRCLVDTGANGGITLPLALKSMSGGNQTLASGLLGGVEAGKSLILPRIEAGGTAWTNVEATFRDGSEEGLIGQDVWAAGPVYFDFIGGFMGIEKTAASELPIRKNPHRSLPIVWDRSSDAPKLVVLMVIPGSEMERAGLKPGDAITGTDGLRGKALTRKALSELLLSGAPYHLTVTRGGSTLALKSPKKAR